MKMTSVLKESFLLYRKHFPQLCLALLVELVLRAIALTPLLFLLNGALRPLAFLSIPLYLLIALPARQNYALALQDMMNGGSVFSLRLAATRDYVSKLGRGLVGTLCMLLWSALTITGAALLFAALKGLVDVISLMRIFARIGGGDIMTGATIVISALAASSMLIMLGCGVHSGNRHAVAMGDKRLVKDHRLALTGLWFIGMLLTVPFLIVVVAAMGDFVLQLVHALKNLQPLVYELSTRQLAMLLGGALVLLFPLLPLKNLLPAVYLRMARENTDAAA